MENKPLWYELFERKDNFHGNFDPLATHDELFYEELYRLCEIIGDEINKSGSDEDNILRTIFLRVYDFVLFSNENYMKIFGEDIHIYTGVCDACFFLALCMFLYNTRRINGMSLREFIYAHSTLNYHDKYIDGKPNRNYFDFNRTPKESLKSWNINGEETKLRQYKYRLLKERPVYNDSPEWSAIPKVSEHEWTLYYNLNNAKGTISDTFKRIKNLYHDVNSALDSPMDSGYEERLGNAFDKFWSKLEKIKYENFLELGKYCLEHINKDKTYYGINLYRFEKEIGLYRITKEVNRLLVCTDEVEESIILDKSKELRGIVFTKVYEYFYNLKTYNQLSFYTCTFHCFINDFVDPFLLVLDKFIEDGVLGDDWENLLVKKMNDLAETVLYDPDKINYPYSVTPESQKMFFRNLFSPVYNKMWRAIRKSRRMQLSDLDDDDI